MKMTAIAEFLFPAPAERRPVAIIRWWEARRLQFNLIVGSAGLVSLSAIAVADTLVFGGGENLLQLLPPAVAFGVAANLCYCLGPAVEVAMERIWGRTLLPVGPSLFRMGLTFSVGLALLPVLVVIIATIAFMVSQLLGLG
jgi:hypothetical protein